MRAIRWFEYNIERMNFFFYHHLLHVLDVALYFAERVLSFNKIPS